MYNLNIKTSEDFPQQNKCEKSESLLLFRMKEREGRKAGEGKEKKGELELGLMG